MESLGTHTFGTLADLRKVLVSMNDSLTPYSSVKEHERYLEHLLHYKKILSNYMSRENMELDICREKSYNIVKNFYIQAEINKKKIIDGCK
jgi:hypothetical protein